MADRVVVAIGGWTVQSALCWEARVTVTLRPTGRKVKQQNELTG